MLSTALSKTTAIRIMPGLVGASDGRPSHGKPQRPVDGRPPVDSALPGDLTVRITRRLPVQASTKNAAHMARRVTGAHIARRVAVTHCHR